MTTTDAESERWRVRFWAAVRYYVSACGGTTALGIDAKRAAEKINAVREIDRAIGDNPRLDAQLRADLAALRSRAATAEEVALRLVEVVRRIARGEGPSPAVQAARALERTADALRDVDATTRIATDPNGRNA